MANSQSSTTSTVPYELSLHGDPDFIDDLEQVNDLYFGHIENSDIVNNFDDYDDGADSDSSVDSGGDSDNENVHDTIVNDSGDANNVIIDPECLKQQEFFKNGCGCSRLHNGKPCTDIVDKSLLISYRLNMQEKTKPELDLIIKAQLFHHRVTDSKNNRGKERQRPRQTYFFAGMNVCRDLFAFAHGIHRKTVDSILRSIATVGIDERTHGNKQSVPKHALGLQEVKYIKQFLTNYASKNGVRLPGRMANFNNLKNILLPSDKNKADIYSVYCEASESSNIRIVSLKSFYRLWQEQCPNIIVMKPATDLCSKCQKFSHTLINSGNCTEEEKQDQLTLYHEHLNKVQCQRDYYRHNCLTSKHSFESLPAENKTRGQSPASVDTTIVYSFDYAQQVLYPHYAQQVGPMFFRTPRKCQCFGVCCESSGSQIFYLVDEAEAIGKGANSVTSMLHHHFQTHGYGEKDVILNMDNCCGQNKNNTVIWYGMWRTLIGAHKSVVYSLMEVGHTKFSPDWHFGLWKSRWRHSTAENMEEVAESVQRSSRSGHNLPQLVNDPQYPVVFFDWHNFLKAFFKKIPNIKKYHYFRMTSSSPGKLFMKEYMFSEEQTFMVLKPNMTITGFPEPIVADGLEPARQWYLYEEIGPLCNNSATACPKPLVPKPSGSKKI